MTDMEMIEKLSRKAGVTHSEAEEALIKSDWDILDAMLYLEKNKGAENVTASTGYSTSQNTQQYEDGKSEPEMGFSGDNSKLRYYLNIGVDWGLKNTIVISRKEKEIIAIPIIFFIVMLVFSISTILVLMLIGMFFDISYSFSGPQLGNETLNRIMKSIYDFVQSLKNGFKT